VEIETLFVSRHPSHLIRRDQAPQAETTSACERVTFSDSYVAVGASGTPFVPSSDTEMLLFQPNFQVEICIPPSFSATTNQTRPLNACHDPTQQALSAHLHSTVSTPSFPDLDENHKYRLISPGRGETRLNSCVCKVLEGRHSTDNGSASQACCVDTIERARGP